MIAVFRLAQTNRTKGENERVRFNQTKQCKLEVSLKMLQVVKKNKKKKNFQDQVIALTAALCSHC